MSHVCAGCVCGVGGLGGHILKYATLSSSALIRPISFLTKVRGGGWDAGVSHLTPPTPQATAPVVAVAVEPKQLQQARDITPPTRYHHHPSNSSSSSSLPTPPSSPLLPRMIALLTRVNQLPLLLEGLRLLSNAPSRFCCHLNTNRI